MDDRLHAAAQERILRRNGQRRLVRDSQPPRWRRDRAAGVARARGWLAARIGHRLRRRQGAEVVEEGSHQDQA